jgi:VWFA-related protein
MRFREFVGSLLVCFLVLSMASVAQRSVSPPPTAPMAEATAQTAVDRRISIDVVVTDKSGKPVAGLRQQDFTLLDDKLPRAITNFRAVNGTAEPDEPMQAILLVDAVNASFLSVSHQRQELENFLREDGGKLLMPTSLVFLTDKSAEIRPIPTRDGNALADSLKSNAPGLRTIGRSQGFYGAVDRAQISLRALEELTAYEATQPGRKLLIWLSTGWPLLSGPHTYLSDKDEQGLFSTVVDLSAALRQARLTIYSIDPVGAADAGSFRSFFYESFVKGVKSAKSVQNGNFGLQVLAVQSGGLVLNSSNDIAGSMAKSVEDGKAFYILSFDSPPADNPNEYHNLQVKIDKPGLTARTRTGYYAQR